MRQMTSMPRAHGNPMDEAATAIAPVVPRLHAGKLCVAIRAESAAEMMERAEQALREARFLELRLDSLAKPAAALGKVRDFLAERRDVTAIATCRRKVNGGNFSGTLASELEILVKAAEAGCAMVDLEVESAEGARASQLEKFRGELRAAGAALLISFHDFMRTRNLEQAADRIAAFEPDFVKVVSTARSLSDNLAVLRLIENRSLSAHVIGIAMGEEGLVSRVLGPRAGAAFTFASFDAGTETAPGQVTARAMNELYRMEQIDQATRIFGVAGNPIAHSLSPLMHNTAFRRENVNAVMLPLKVRALNDLLTLVQELPLGGVAVTMPLKQEVLPYLANMDPLTAQHRRVQHAAHRRGRQAVRVQHGRGRRGAAAGEAAAAAGRAGGWCWARAARRGRRSSGWWTRARRYSSSTAPTRRRCRWRGTPRPSR